MLRSQIRANVAYALGRVATSAGLFVLMPFLVNRLTPEEYGAWALLEVVILLFSILVTLGLEFALMRMHWVLNNDLQRSALAGVILFAVVGWGAFVVIVGSAVAPMLLGGAPVGSMPVWRLTLATSWAEGVFVVVLAIFRVREKAVEFAVLSTTRSLLFVVIALALVAQGFGIGGGLAGRLLGSLTVTAMAFALAVSRGWIARPGGWENFRTAARFGLPLIPSKLASYVLFAADRYFLGEISGLATVGIYSFAYKIGTTQEALVTRPFAADWAARRYRIASEPEPEKLYAQALTLYIYPAIAFSLLVWAVTPLVYELFAPPPYTAGMGAVPILLLSGLVFGLSYPLNIGIMLRGRSELLSIITGVSAGVSLLLYGLLIPRYGMFGAAWATLLAYSVYTTLIFATSLRLYPVRYPIRPLIGALLLVGGGAAGLNFAGVLLEQASPWVRVVTNLAVVLGMLGLVMYAYRTQARSMAQLLLRNDEAPKNA